MGYTRSIQKEIQVVVAHIFNPSTREVETGAIWLGRDRNIKGKRQDSLECGVRAFVETGSCPFKSLKIW